MTYHPHRRWRTLLLTALATVPQFAQTPAPVPTEFEVVSIKPGDPSDQRVRIEITPGGRFTASNISVKLLIQQAYGVRDFQIIGAPAWIDKERFVIEAKAEGQVPPDQLKPLLQSMLATRFKLKLHRDTRELPIYHLVVAKNGPKLKESEAGARGPMIRMGRGSIDGQGMQMSMLVNQLARPLGRNVIDQTGLTGRYDVKLEWTPDDSEMQGPKDVGRETTAPVASSGPTIFTAVQEQLGLKLESAKGPVEILVIDSVEKPTEN